MTSEPETPPPTTRTPTDPWSRQTKDYWFFGVLTVMTVAVLYLFSPYMYDLMFAAVVVVVTWPIFTRVLAWCGGRRAIGALVTMGLLAFVIFGPLGFLLYLFVQQGIVVVQKGIDFVNSGQLAGWVSWAVALPEHSEMLPEWARRFVPEDFDLQASVAGPLQDGALATLNAAGSAVPSLVQTTAEASVHGAIFLFAVVSLYMEGPRVLQVIKNLSPMDDAYEERLFGVFGEFANNLVIGSLATSACMAVVAGIGYAMCGVDRVIFFATLTGVLSFVPVVGSALVWVPLSISVGVTSGWGWGGVLLGWNVVVTTHVDTFIRPLFMRGKTNIHPLLVFLAVFGGMAWMGLPGALVGPVLVAGFLAMYTIYVEDYLGASPEPEPAAHAPAAPGWMRRLGRARPEAPATAAGLVPAQVDVPPPPDVSPAPAPAPAPDSTTTTDA